MRRRTPRRRDPRGKLHARHDVTTANRLPCARPPCSTRAELRQRARARTSTRSEPMLDTLRRSSMTTIRAVSASPNSTRSVSAQSNRTRAGAAVGAPRPSRAAVAHDEYGGADAAAATTVARPHRARPPAPPFFGPLEEGAVDLVRVGRRELAPAAARTSRAPRDSRSARATCSARRAAASRRESRTSETAPVAGSAIGSGDAADVGEALLPDRILDHDRDDVPAAGACVQPRVRRGGARKSEKTKTKLPPGRSARCAPRKASARSSVSSGASNARVARARVDEPRPVARAPGGSHQCAVAAGEVERGEVGARRDGARDDRGDGLAQRRRLRQPRQRRRVEAHRRPPVEHERDARRLVGERGRGRRTRRGRVAADRRAVANQSIVETGSPGSYGRDADHLAAGPAPARSEVAERQPGQARAAERAETSRRSRPATGVSCPSRARAAARARGSAR